MWSWWESVIFFFCHCREFILYKIEIHNKKKHSDSALLIFPLTFFVFNLEVAFRDEYFLWWINIYPKFGNTLLHFACYSFGKLK